MTERKHSPLPWGIDCDDYDSSIIKSIGPLSSDNYAGSSWLCFEDDQDENVTFMLRAVNSHYELVDVVETVLAHIEGGNDFHCTETNRMYLKQALSKAKGEA